MSFFGGRKGSESDGTGRYIHTYIENVDSMLSSHPGQSRQEQKRTKLKKEGKKSKNSYSYIPMYRLVSGWTRT